MVRKKPGRRAEPEAKGRIAWPRWTGFSGKTVWDWMDLLIVPLALVVIGLGFAMLQDARQQEIENQRAQQAQKIENQRAEAERELAEQRAQDEALQSYLDQMSQLMLDRKLLEAEQGTPLYTLAQARTSTVILRLDAEHNESVTRFLINSGLAVSSEASPRLLREITLSQATLSDAHLPNADLGDADLRGADLSHALLDNANLIDAKLREADLSGASLSGASLSGALLFDAALSFADLFGADLSDANLREADLSDATLSGADLSGADLSGADLSGATLRGVALGGASLEGADLRGADLRGADLRGVFKFTQGGSMQQITNEELEQQARSLERATMPNGQKYEDWLKSKGRGQDRDNPALRNVL